MFLFALGSWAIATVILTGMLRATYLSRKKLEDRIDNLDAEIVAAIASAIQNALRQEAQ